MKITWKWLESDMRDFPHVKSASEDIEVDEGSCETLQDLVWRISTEIYLRHGIVVPTERSVSAHVENWNFLKEMFNVS